MANKLLPDNFGIVSRILFKTLRPVLSDRQYAIATMKRRLGGGDIDTPNTFNEKIQWLKLHHRIPQYRTLVDKYSVRKYVGENCGSELLCTLYGSYTHESEIDTTTLPSHYVMKATHGSGMNLIVTPDAKVTAKILRKKAKEWLRTDYSRKGREWVYKGVEHRIICEELLTNRDGTQPNDYKIFCFNGSPRFIQVDQDRFRNHTRAYYDCNWEKQDFNVLFPTFEGHVPPPPNLRRMLSIARKLSKDIPFVRVDLYSTPDLKFGEMTLYPGNGFEPFLPKEWDLKLGTLLRLPASADG